MSVSTATTTLPQQIHQTVTKCYMELCARTRLEPLQRFSRHPVTATAATAAATAAGEHLPLKRPRVCQP